MESRICCFILSSLLLLHFLNSQATSSLIERLGSFRHLEGSKKGDKREGIEKVKQYLQRYGYLNNNINNSQSTSDYSTDSDEFDNVLESSLKDFQSFYSLETTGMLDEATTTLMSKPRCGWPDHPLNSNGRVDSSNIHPKNAIWEEVKWPPEKMHMHYIVLPNNNPEAPIRRAFDAWAAVSNFTFERVREESFALLKLSFVVMDGKGTLLGQAAAPVPNSTASIIFDTQECWTDGATPDCVDLETLATHEIGHVLGLLHSQLLSANMYAFIDYGETKPLTQDDIMASELDTAS